MFPDAGEPRRLSLEGILLATEFPTHYGEYIVSRWCMPKKGKSAAPVRRSGKE